MKRVFFAIVLVAGAFAAAPVNAAFLGIQSIGLYNTGTVADGSDKAADPSNALHYALTANNSNVNDPLQVLRSGLPNGNVNAWIPDAPAQSSNSTPGVVGSDASAWIGDRQTSGSGSFEFVVQTGFNLTGLDTSTVEIGGRFATDNASKLYLNGVDTGYRSNGYSNSVAAYSNWSGFLLSESFFALNGSSAAFNAGANTLEWRVLDDGGWFGVRAEFTSLQSTPVPAPAALGLFALGLPALGFVRKRFARKS